jgi:abortive infection bacteriophage resistance protein
MSKHSKENNTARVSKDAKEVIFLENFKGDSLENIIDYWALVNVVDFGEALSVTENLKIKHAINVIKAELNKASGDRINTISIKDLLK